MYVSHDPGPYFRYLFNTENFKIGQIQVFVNFAKSFHWIHMKLVFQSLFELLLYVCGIWRGVEDAGWGVLGGGGGEFEQPCEPLHTFLAKPSV